MRVDRYKIHDIEIVIDRLVIVLVFKNKHFKTKGFYYYTIFIQSFIIIIEFMVTIVMADMVQLTAAIATTINKLVID